MKGFIFILSIMLSMVVKADTISFWHVYYNQTKIRQFSDYANNEITLNLSSVKNTDSITVIYYCDTPCDDCLSTLSIWDGKQLQYFITIKGKGSSSPLSFPLSVLLAHGGKIFEVDYCRGDEHCDDLRFEHIPLFKIKLE